MGGIHPYSAKIGKFIDYSQPLIIKSALALFELYEIQRRQPSIATHRRDFKDCKQILEDSLTPPLHIKARSRLQPDKPSEDLP